MNSKNSSLVAAALALAAIEPASAHGVAGTLLRGNTVTDLLSVTCSTDVDGAATDHLAVEVSDDAPILKANRVNVQIVRPDKKLAGAATDPIDGDGKFGPLLKVGGGNGVYYVMVNKAGVAAENYRLQVHCQSIDDIHTPTVPRTLQNQ